MASKEVQEYKYTANNAWPEPPAKRTGIHIKQMRGATVVDGVRRSVGEIRELTAADSKTRWKTVFHKAGTDEAIGEALNDAHNNTWGILTPGQFQCMCIIVAIFENESDSMWSRAWLTHISSEYASEVNQMVGKLTAENCGKAYVAIGGKKGSASAMRTIMEAFEGPAVPDRRLRPQPPTTPYPSPVFKPVTVMVYAGGADDEPFGFGLNKNGLVGEVTGQM